MINPIDSNINIYQNNSIDDANALDEYMKELKVALIQIILAAMSGDEYEIVTSKDDQGHPHIKVVLKSNSSLMALSTGEESKIINSKDAHGQSHLQMVLNGQLGGGPTLQGWVERAI